MSRKSEPEPTIDTSTTAPRKRSAKRTESDETKAMRALRQYRQLAEREQAARARCDETLTAVANERSELGKSLSPEVIALVNAMQAATRGNGGTP